jgi:hypothetical protein
LVGLSLFQLVILRDERIPRVAEGLIEFAVVSDEGGNIKVVIVLWRLVVCGRRSQIRESRRVGSGSKGISNEIMRRDSSHVVRVDGAR